MSPLKDQDSRYDSGTFGSSGSGRTIHVPIDSEHVAAAKALAKTKPKQPFFWADTGQPGLFLKVVGGSASWILRRGKKTKVIAPAGRMMPHIARERALHGRELIDAGVDPTPYWRALAAGRTEKQAKEAAFEEAGKQERPEPAPEPPPAWTWSKVVAEYKKKVAAGRRTKAGHYRPPSAETAKELDRIFALTPLQRFNDRLAPSIRRDEIEKAGNEIRQAHGGSTHKKSIIYLRATFRWANAEHGGLSGLDQVPNPWWDKIAVPTVTDPGRGKRRLSVDQIARVLAVAEVHRHLPGRKIRKPTSEVALCALWWIVLTVQRRGAALNARLDWMAPDPKAPGWTLIAYPAVVMKSRRDHALPLHPVVTDLIVRARAAHRGWSAWLFPSGRGPGDEPVSDSIVTLLIRRLRGEDEIGKAAGARDLLEGIPHFSPHDLRASCTTELGDAMIRGDAISAILDHDMPETDKNHEPQPAAITRLAYDRSQKLALKRIAMEAWADLVLDAYERELDRILAGLTEPLPHEPWRPEWKSEIIPLESK